MFQGALSMPITDQPSVLVVDDEANIRRTLAICLEAEHYQISSVASSAEALAEASRQYFDLAFVDLRLGTQSGMDLVPNLIVANPGIKIVIITAYATIESAVEAMKRGAFDYLPKPFTPEQVTLWAKKALQARKQESRIQELGKPGFEEDMESRSLQVQRALALARSAAASDASILLRGETGTGKGVFARAIHSWSHRKSGPFAVVSCPSIPTELLESELFGHVQGAFTGAHKEQAGRVAQAQGGTLFMDEIGDLPLNLQPKLLRFLQDHEYERLGESMTRKADVRVIAATNADLKAAVAAGKFREDLYYRLNVIEIDLPGLRQRSEDILPLALKMLGHFAAENKHAITGFNPEAQAVLQGHAWPGNLRELRNAVERAAILCLSGEVGLEHLPGNFQPKAVGQKIGDAVTLEALEESHIRSILASNRSLEEVARILGIDVATLWRKRKKYGIQA
jgi:NtrC-family two-component system response regulator AlgB